MFEVRIRTNRRRLRNLNPCLSLPFLRRMHRDILDLEVLIREILQGKSDSDYDEKIVVRIDEEGQIETSNCFWNQGFSERRTFFFAEIYGVFFRWKSFFACTPWSSFLFTLKSLFRLRENTRRATWCQSF